MNDNVVRLEPTPIVLFASIDADPGFSIKLCNEASLFRTVQEALFFGPAALDAEQIAEVADTVEKLKESGNLAFEDGWMCLCTGMADVTAFLMQKIKETKEEASWADEERCKEIRRREDAEARFRLLQHALIDAVGDKVLELAAATTQAGAPA
jgi:hypothetical protein